MTTSRFRHRYAAAGALVLATIIALASTAIAQTPSADPSPSPTPVSPNEARPSQISSSDEPTLWDIPGRISYGINHWLGQLAGSALSAVFSLLSKTVFSTPQIQEQPRIAELWTVSAGIANGALILFVLVGSGLIMGGGGLASNFH